MEKVLEIELENCCEIEIFKNNPDEVGEDGYEFFGIINKDGEMLENFEGSGNFATIEDVVTYLKNYLSTETKTILKVQSFSDVLLEVRDAVSELSGEELAQLASQILSKNIEYEGDSLFTSPE